MPATLLAAALLLASGSAAAQQAVISHAEQPPRLIRKTTVHQAFAGVRLQAGDIVESATHPVQIEWPNGARIALGPASSILVHNAAGLPSATVLRGWSKFAATAPAGGRLALEAGALALQATAASGIVYLAADSTELFVESGTVPATDMARAAMAAVPVGSGQYAVRHASRPLDVAPRAPRLFIGRMPRAFLDPLVAVAALVPAAAAVPQRDVDAADIAAWRDAGTTARRRLANQFAPRLADPAFRRDAESLLAGQAEWRDALRRHNALKNRTSAPLNQLF